MLPGMPKWFCAVLLLPMIVHATDISVQDGKDIVSPHSSASPRIVSQVDELRDILRRVTAAKNLRIDPDIRAEYRAVLEKAQAIVGNEEWVASARDENRLKSEKIGGILRYPWGVNDTNGYLEQIATINGFPYLNSMAEAVYCLVMANSELGRTSETLRYMNMLLDELPLHQIPSFLYDDGRRKTLVGFRNFLVSWEEGPPDDSEEGRVTRLYWTILKERNMDSLKPAEVHYRTWIVEGRKTTL